MHQLIANYRYKMSVFSTNPEFLDHYLVEVPVLHYSDMPQDGGHKDHLKRVACQAIDDAAKELNQLSQDIWNHPELAYEEHHAHQSLTKYFEEKGFPVERNYVVDTGFRSIYGDVTNKPNIAVLCEYDALPDIGHACGHNLIAEVGVATSLGLKAALDEAKNHGDDIGQLTVLGTPAEEGGNGKEVLIQGGALQGVDAALMAHPGHLNILVSPGDTCVISCEVRYIGKESHAADTPWDGVNALDAAFMAYGSVSVLRQQMKPSWRVHGIITKGGTRPNIIPGETTMEFYVRAPILKDLQVLKEKVQRCLQSAATATGCTVEIKWAPHPYLNVITNKTLGTLYNVNAAALGIDLVQDFKGDLAGSTDMGNVTHVVPGIHPIFYVGSEAKCHTKDFTAVAGSPAAQPYTLKQAKALAMTALDVYCDPDLLQDMKSQLAQDLDEESKM